jgi:phosphomannomutase
LASVATSSGVAFGTSGARGLVSAMTDRVCFAYVCGFLQHMAAQGMFGAGGEVAIAGDLRPSSPRIARACAAAVRHMGGVPLWCGFVPSPAVAAFGFMRGIPSLMVTGSHIPDDRNGIKFNRTDGEILKDDERAISAQTVEIPEALFNAAGMLRDPVALGDPADAAAAYVARYTGFFAPDSLAGLRLGIYQHSAVGRDILTDVVAALGAVVVPLGRSDRFIPVDTEAVRPEDVVLGAQWAVEHHLDAILSTDGDSDRPLIADEQGAWLRGDVLGILASRYLGASHVVTPVTSNSALELTGWFASTHRTRIGSPFVIEGMQAAAGADKVVVGYEANGGLLLGSSVSRDGLVLDALPTRDALLPMLVTLAAARDAGASLGSLVAALPPRVTVSDRLTDFPIESSRKLLEQFVAADEARSHGNFTRFFGGSCGEIIAIDWTDGARATNGNGDVIHLRPSGNAPELRCYVESTNAQDAAALNRIVLRAVADWHGSSSGRMDNPGNGASRNC